MSSKKNTTATQAQAGGSAGYVYKPAARPPGSPAPGAVGVSKSAPAVVPQSESSSAAAKHIARAKQKAAADYAARQEALKQQQQQTSTQSSPALGPTKVTPTVKVAAGMGANVVNPLPTPEGHTSGQQGGGTREASKVHTTAATPTNHAPSSGWTSSNLVSRLQSAEPSRNYSTAFSSHPLDFQDALLGGGGGGAGDDYEDPPSDHFDLPIGFNRDSDAAQQQQQQGNGGSGVAGGGPSRKGSMSGAHLMRQSQPQQSLSVTSSPILTSVTNEEAQQRPAGPERRKSVDSRFSQIALSALQQVRTGKTAPNSPQLGPQQPSRGKTAPNSPQRGSMQSAASSASSASDAYKRSLRLEVQRLLLSQGIDAIDSEAAWDATPEAVANLQARGIFPPTKQATQQTPVAVAAGVGMHPLSMPPATLSIPANQQQPQHPSPSPPTISRAVSSPGHASGGSAWSSIASSAIQGVRVTKGEEISRAGQQKSPPVAAVTAVQPASTPSSAVVSPRDASPSTTTSTTTSPAFSNPAGTLPAPMVLGSPASSNSTSPALSATPSAAAAGASAAAPTPSASSTTPGRSSGRSLAGPSSVGGRWDFLASAAIQHVRAKTKEIQIASGEPEESPFARSTVPASKGAAAAAASKDVGVWTTSSSAAAVPPSTVKLPACNSSAVLLSTNNLTVRSTPLPPLTPGSVLVEMHAVGICGSDVHYLTHGAIADFILRSPMVVGHESAGRVVAIGAGVNGVKVGDRVALEPGVSCGTCVQCKFGAYNLCPEMKFLATPPVHGSIANHIVHPAHLCHVLPDSVSYEQGALCEPLSVAIHACRRACLEAGASVLITGAGPIGILCAMVARASGARRIVLVDVTLPRLRLAQEILRTDAAEGAGVVSVVHAPVEMNPEEAVKQIRKAVNPQASEESLSTTSGVALDGVDVAFECSGAESATRTALCSIRSVLTRQVDIRGIFRYANCYPHAVAMIAGGRLQVEKMVTHRYALRTTNTATAAGTTAATTPSAAHVVTPATPSSPAGAVSSPSSPSSAASTANPSEVAELGVLSLEQLLAGFETAKTGKGKDDSLAIKVMFSL